MQPAKGENRQQDNRREPGGPGERGECVAAGPWCRTGEAAGRGAEEKEGLAGGLQFLVERKEASAGQRETQREQTEDRSVKRPTAFQDRRCKCSGPWLSHPQVPGCPPPQCELPLRMSVSAQVLWSGSPPGGTAASQRISNSHQEQPHRELCHDTLVTSTCSSPCPS